MSRRERDKGRLAPFVPLLITTIDSRAWCAMSRDVRCLYISLRRRVPNGRNKAYLSYRQAELELRASQRKIAVWFRELVYYGFIVLHTHGSLGVDGKGKSPHWRLTELGQTRAASSSDQPEHPTCDFLKWNGVRFPRTRRITNPDYRRKKQNPASHGGYGVYPTGDAGVLPTRDTSVVAGVAPVVCIESEASVAPVVGITSLPLQGHRRGARKPARSRP